MTSVYRFQTRKTPSYIVYFHLVHYAALRTALKWIYFLSTAVHCKSAHGNRDYARQKKGVFPHNSSTVSISSRYALINQHVKWIILLSTEAPARLCVVFCLIFLGHLFFSESTCPLLSQWFCSGCLHNNDSLWFKRLARVGTETPGFQSDKNSLTTTVFSLSSQDIRHAHRCTVL